MIDIVARLRTKHIFGMFEIEEQRLEAADEIERLRSVAQRQSDPAVIERAARIAAKHKGHRNCDEEIMTTDAGKQPVWKFYVEEAREILALSASPPSPVAGEWQKIETAPKDGTVIFVTAHTEFYGWVRGTSHWESHQGISGWVLRGVSEPPGELGLANPSHWQPLPASPLSSTDRAVPPAERGSP